MAEIVDSPAWPSHEENFWPPPACPCAGALGGPVRTSNFQLELFFRRLTTVDAAALRARLEALSVFGRPAGGRLPMA